MTKKARVSLRWDEKPESQIHRYTDAGSLEMRRADGAVLLVEWSENGGELAFAFSAPSGRVSTVIVGSGHDEAARIHVTRGRTAQ